MSFADGNTGLADTADALFDQGLVSIVKWLVATDEKGCRLSGVKHGMHRLGDRLRPVFRRAFRRYLDVDALGRFEQTIRIGEPPFRDPIDPDDERITEGRF